MQCISRFDHRAFLFALAVTFLVTMPHTSSAQLLFGFDDGELPAGTFLYGTAVIGSDGSDTNKCLHLTDTFNSAHGHFLVPNLGEGKLVREIQIRWRSRIGGGTGGGADGYSLNWAADLPGPPVYGNPGEDGAGSGLSATVDTYDSGANDATGLEIRWRSNIVASVVMPKNNAGGGLAYLRRDEFVAASLTVDTSGLATFTYDGVAISAQLADWKGVAHGDLLLSARTGAANDRHWIDDLQITTGVYTAGSFSGLVLDKQNWTHDHSGAVSLKVTAQGAYSGYLILGGVRIPLSGVFDLNSVSSRVELVRPGTTTMTVELTLIDKDTIDGIVGDGTWRVGLRADRLAWHKKLQPASDYTGQYVVVVGAGRGSQVPNGYGYGNVTIDAGGGVKFVGVLGDGTKVTQKSALSTLGHWPFFAVTHGGRGSIHGWMRPHHGRSSKAEVAWFKLDGAAGPLYPDGFSLLTEMAIDPYTPPAAGQRILPIAAGTAMFSSGEVSIETDFGLTLANVVVDLGANGLVAKFTPKTGRLNGSVINPETGKKVKFSGVAFATEEAAFGHFIGTNESGAVWFGVER